MPHLPNARPVPKQSIVRRVRGYVPVCLFARGGMAQVFLARETDSDSGRLVAIKTLRISYIGDTQQTAMFSDEMRIAHLLRHPNIVELVEAGVIEGEPFLVLEHIDGPSLRELANWHQGKIDPMGVRLAASLLHGAACGLHYAHELDDEWGTPLRLVHRDVSPQNLMVTRGGLVKVLDFGVAKAVGQSHQTVGRNVKGKMAYAAPEYVRGKKPDQRADVFGLGVVLWEMLTNRRCFFKDTAVATMQSVVYERADPPSRWNGEVPTELDTLVLYALEKDPEDRLPSMAAFEKRLRKAALPVGGIMTSEQIAVALATDYADIMENRVELNVRMSDDELSRSASRPVLPEFSPPPSQGHDPWHSVEIDLTDLGDDFDDENDEEDDDYDGFTQSVSTEVDTRIFWDEDKEDE